jgi:hypothetical protein
MNRTAAFALIMIVVSQFGISQQPSITKINFPAIPGYQTLKCDLHMHTVFSDGSVWPTFRVDEAWGEGLDAIAITDHLEYLPKKERLNSDRNTSIELALAAAKSLGLIVIPGAEFTRKMPPGHLNALFVKDANALVKDDWKEAVKEATKQGALLIWNHPGWESQQPDGMAHWYDEHTSLYESGALAGMEIVNTKEYYPEVFRWCLEKNVAAIGSSDTHDPIKSEYDAADGEHRPLTLVFAKEKSLEAIREALVAGRTVVYAKNELYGKEYLLKELVQASITWSTRSFSMMGRERSVALVTNSSEIPLELTLVEPDKSIQFPREIRLKPGKATLFPIRARKDSLDISRRMDVSYMIKNCTVAPDKNLIITVPLDVMVSPKK